MALAAWFGEEEEILGSYFKKKKHVKILTKTEEGSQKERWNLDQGGDRQRKIWGQNQPHQTPGYFFGWTCLLYPSVVFVSRVKLAAHLGHLRGFWPTPKCLLFYIDLIGASWNQKPMEKQRFWSQKHWLLRTKNCGFGWLTGVPQVMATIRPPSFQHCWWSSHTKLTFSGSS